MAVSGAMPVVGMHHDAGEGRALAEYSLEAPWNWWERLLESGYFACLRGRLLICPSALALFPTDRHVYGLMQPFRTSPGECMRGSFARWDSESGCRTLSPEAGTKALCPQGSVICIVSGGVIDEYPLDGSCTITPTS